MSVPLASKETIIWRLLVRFWLQARNQTGILNICTQWWLNESEKSDPHGFNKGRSSKFRVGSQVRHTPKEGWRTYWLKCWQNNNKHEDNRLKTLNDKKFIHTYIQFLIHFERTIYTHTYVHTHTHTHTHIYEEIVDFGKCDKMIKISGKVNKSTYIRFISRISFFIQERTSSDKTILGFFYILAIEEIDKIWVKREGKGLKTRDRQGKKMEGNKYRFEWWW